MLQFIQDHMGWVAFGVSELIGLIPGLKSSSVFQLIVSLLKAAIDGVTGTTPTKS